MVASPALALQSAVFAVLTGGPYRVACGFAPNVFDHVPMRAVPPYWVISDIQADGPTEQGYAGRELHANLVAWSSKPGKVELQTMVEAAISLLAPPIPIGAQAAPPFALAGHRLVSWRFLQATPMNDADGISVKSIVRLLYLTEPTGS